MTSLTGDPSLRSTGGLTPLLYQDGVVLKMAAQTALFVSAAQIEADLLPLEQRKESKEGEAEPQERDEQTAHRA